MQSRIINQRQRDHVPILIVDVTQAQVRENSLRSLQSQRVAAGAHLAQLNHVLYEAQATLDCITLTSENALAAAYIGPPMETSRPAYDTYHSFPLFCLVLSVILVRGRGVP